LRGNSSLRSRLAAVAVCALAALTLSTPAARAAADPEPLQAGPLATKKIDYESGKLLVTLADGVSTTLVPLRGSVTYAPENDFSRVIVFVHGRHAVCLGAPSPGQLTCDDLVDENGTPIQSDVRSYGGYDYMAKNLASHGYLVLSIEANTSNFDNAFTDGGARVRSQITQAHLELLFRWNKAAGPYVAGEPDHTIGTKLVGKVNFAEGIGLMGHSRGGDAVTDFIAYTRNLVPRAGFQRFTLDAVLALAPVNYTQAKMPYGTNYAVLLPACDGDVSTLQGARFFENAKYPSITTPTAVDAFAKVQWYVQGANHNFFNTVWTGDDSSTTTDPACSRQQPATTARLTPADQRRVGAGLMNSFMRRYVGKETQFDPVMTGETLLPASAEPLTSGKGAGQTVKTSYVAPAAERFDVLRPNPIPDPQPDPATGATPTPADPTLTTTTASGGPISTSGLTSFAVCNPNDLAWRQGPTFPTAYPLCPEGALNRSKGNQFTLSWDAPGAYLRAFLGRAGAPVDVSRFGVLDLRAAVNRTDPRNPAGDGFTPTLVTQNFDVTLIDATGKRVSTRAASWSTALQPSIGNQRHITLNGIRIPLTAFAGIDLTKVTAVELGFGVPAMGSIQLADLMFQEKPGATPPPSVKVPDAVPVADGPPSVLPGPVVGEPTVALPLAKTPLAAPLTTCVDTVAPTTRVTTVKRTGRTLRVAGTAADTGCGAALQSTLVEIFRATGKGKARFLTARGTLSKALPLAGGVSVKATGTSRWSVRVAKAKLPRGTYKVRVSTFDRAGNLTRAPLVTLKVR
jgi:hypothetical protein